VLTLNWNNNTFKLSNTERFVFSAISLLCIVIEEIVLASIINSSHILQKHELYSQALVFILVFFLFFSLVFYVYNLGIQKERNTFLLEENLLTKLNTQQYEQITVQVEELRIIRHDITNHLNALSMLINEKEYVEASNYLSTITNDLSIHHNLLSSGNVAIDSIISCKIIQAQSKNIPINYTIQLPAFLPLDNVDLCSLLGNLLDNSIEACEKIKRPHKRSILLNIKPFNGMLSIKLTNSSNGIYNMDVSGNMLSTKDNYSEHGLGTKQINKIIKKYNGFSRFSPEADAFTAEILFPLTNPTTYETEV
jgi:sensor histidine kinase regulating citrate/malate metabolism